MNKWFPRSVLSAVLLLGAATLAGCGDSDPTPSPAAEATSGGTSGGTSSEDTSDRPSAEDITSAIQREFTEVYGVDNGFAEFEAIDFEFGEPVVGELTEKQMESGALARPVWPVRISVRMTVTYSNNPESSVVERGATSNDVFFFYKDAFGEWNFKTGSL